MLICCTLMGGQTGTAIPYHGVYRGDPLPDTAVTHNKALDEAREGGEEWTEVAGRPKEVQASPSMPMCSGMGSSAQADTVLSFAAAGAELAGPTPCETEEGGLRILGQGLLPAR